MDRYVHHLCILHVALLSALPSVSLYAQPTTPPGPWHQGVEADDKARARDLFEQGVVLHKQLLWADALALYEQALSRWPEHPEIHFYAARALDKLGKFVRAYEHLENSLRWAAQGLNPVDYRFARAMQARLIKEELGRITVIITEPGTRVSLDGKHWFTAPGTEQAVVQHGMHEVVSAKTGYFTEKKSTAIVAGKQATLDETMQRDRGVMIRYKLRPWISWVVIGSGAVLGLTGGALFLKASIDFASYDRLLPGEPCYPNCLARDVPYLTSLHNRAKLEQKLSIGSFAAGGAALTVGLALLLVNRPYPWRDEHIDSDRWRVTPLAAPNLAGVSLSRSF